MQTTRFVYIIRHGEKTWAAGCLSKSGEARARALPGLFNGAPSPVHDTFQAPSALFAHYYDDPIDCERCKQTLTPISEAQRLPIEFHYGSSHKLGGNAAAASAILNATSHAGVVLVAWEHVNIQYLTADLGVNSSLIPHWSDGDYDSVYILELGAAGQVVNFTVTAQHFGEPDASSDSPTRPHYRVGVLIAKGFFLIDAMGPLDVMRCAQLKAYEYVNLTSHEYRPDRPPAIVGKATLEVTLLADTIAPVMASSGVTVTPDAPINASVSYDLLVIGAGVDTPAVRSLLQVHYAAGGAVMSVCTGADLLAQLGWLDGKVATSNSLLLWRLRRDYPAVRWVSLRDRTHERFIVSEPPLRLVTTAGVTAGSDGALHYLAAWLGADAAEAVREFIEWPLPLER